MTKIPVKPFKLVPGCYVETTDGDLYGPLEQYGDSFGVGGTLMWSVNGAPTFSGAGQPRVKTVITGPVALNAYIDRLQCRNPSLRNQMNDTIARRALDIMRLPASKTEDSPVQAMEAKPVGEAATQAIETLLREIIREEMRTVIREEIPSIVADATNPFNGSDLRLAVTVSALRD